MIRLRAVLLVDDDVGLLRIMERSLRREGCDVRVAHSAHQAIEEIARRAPDVIVTDQEMGATTGTKLLETVAAGYPEVLRVLHTGSPAIEWQSFLWSGVVQVAVEKPATIAELLIAISGDGHPGDATAPKLR